MQWQQQVLNQWEATGYRHDDPLAPCLLEQLPIRLHVDGDFIADALDSADHTAPSSRLCKHQPGHYCIWHLSADSQQVMLQASLFLCCWHSAVLAPLSSVCCHAFKVCWQAPLVPALRSCS